MWSGVHLIRDQDRSQSNEVFNGVKKGLRATAYHALVFLITASLAETPLPRSRSTAVRDMYM